MIPQLPDRYRPTRPIGTGATGVVWHAYDDFLDTDVAVKVVKSNLSLHRRFRARFAREVSIGARIVHPHVVPVHDTGVLSTGEPFVALGYAVGGSLADLLKLHPPIDDVLRLMDEVLDALGAIHAQLLVHQDLKPSNVLLYAGTDGQVHAWVADLGVADALAELNRDRKVISGTPGYMAPEQLIGRTQDLGPWTDLYAVGLMLYETLSGERPHKGEGRAELLESRLLAPPPLPIGGESHTPPALAEFVATLLDPEPRQRFDRAVDVRRALRDAMKGASFRGRVRGIVGPASSSLSTAPVLVTGEYPLSIQPPSGPLGEAVPRWNRVAADPITTHPPPEYGWEAPARSSLELFALREVPLVGRERERQVLWDAAREVVALTAPRVVLVVGESGSGKTRLVSSVATALDQSGWLEAVRLRYHSPPGVDDGYRGAVRDLLVPWNDSREGMEARLARWIARDRQVPPAQVREEASILTRWCGYLGEGETPVTDAVSLAYLYRHLDARAWRGGSCLVIEDAHHARADGDGLAIAEALLDRTVGERPVLALVTISAEAIQRDQQLRRKVEGLQERGARRIGLRRLNLTETRKVLAESLLLDPDLLHMVALECEGDPLKAGMLLREWAARRALVPNKHGQYRLAPTLPIEDAIPPDFETLLRRRLQSAIESCPDPGAAADAVALVALAGQEPPVALVRRVNDAGVDALLATGILAEERGYLVFEHSRLRHVALQQVQRWENVEELHRRLAEAWQDLGATTGLDVDLPLGLHRLAAKDAERAVGPLLNAVRRMNHGGRARDAIAAAVACIEAADAVGQPGGRLEARRLHAMALLEAGHPERARSLVDHALREIEGDRLGRARLRILAGRAARKLGDADSAHRELDLAHQVFTAMRDRTGLVEVAVERAKLARFEGRQDVAIDRWGEVLRLNRGDLVLEAEGINGLVEALLAAGRLEHIDRQIQRLHRVARESGDTRRVAEATCTAGLICLERREIDQAERHLTSAGAIAATLGADTLHLRGRTALAEVHLYRGDLDAAEETWRWAARFADERGMGIEVANARIRLALVHLARDAGRRIRPELDEAEARLGVNPRHGLWMHLAVLRCLLAAWGGDDHSARAWWDVAVKSGVDNRHAPELWRALERLATAAEERGWSDLAGKARARSQGGSSSVASAEVVDEE